MKTIQALQLLKLGQSVIIASEKSLKPPKGWWNEMKKEGKADELIGHIWYHKLDDAKRAEIRNREGKEYKPAND